MKKKYVVRLSDSEREICKAGVSNIRQQFVELGFDETLNRKKSPAAGAKKLLDGNQDAKVIARRLSCPPQGCGK